MCFVVTYLISHTLIVLFVCHIFICDLSHEDDKYQLKKIPFVWMAGAIYKIGIDLNDPCSLLKKKSGICSNGYSYLFKKHSDWLATHSAAGITPITTWSINLGNACKWKLFETLKKESLYITVLFTAKRFLSLFLNYLMATFRNWYFFCLAVHFKLFKTFHLAIHCMLTVHIFSSAIHFYPFKNFHQLFSHSNHLF